MEKVKGKSDLSNLLVEKFPVEGGWRPLGFVPTMGALHAGHISLMHKAREACPGVVVSIFVNPTQFNDPEDLRKYPRTPDADAALVESAGVDVLWLPEVVDLYGASLDCPRVDLGACTAVLEAAHRPGHFDGVVTVVGRLLEAVRPDVLYLGEKDLQQVAVLRAWAKTAFPELQLVVCPTARDPDGLAMSSRNARLRPDPRRIALQLPAALSQCAAHVQAGMDLRTALDAARERLKRTDGLACEYFEAVHPETFLPAEAQAEGPVYAVAAAVVDGVRLIDNVRLA
jgi:pantoate--beta-alanine ligase